MKTQRRGPGYPFSSVISICHKGLQVGKGEKQEGGPRFKRGYRLVFRVTLRTWVGLLPDFRLPHSMGRKPCSPTPPHSLPNAHRTIFCSVPVGTDGDERDLSDVKTWLVNDREFTRLSLAKLEANH